MAKRKKNVSFVTKSGEHISFTANPGKKKRRNPKRKLTPWNKYIKNNMKRCMREYDCDAPEAMQILADEFHN